MATKCTLGAGSAPNVNHIRIVDDDIRLIPYFPKPKTAIVFFIIFSYPTKKSPSVYLHLLLLCRLPAKKMAREIGPIRPKYMATIMII